MKEGDRAVHMLAEETGGQVLTAPIKRLGSVCGTIVTELSDRYTLGYIATNARHDGSFRRVSVKITQHPNLEARTRSGYIAASECARCPVASGQHTKH